jgi:hypothetical protein
MFYYIALKFGNFLLEILDTFPLLKDAYTQSRKLYENWLSSWYGALQLTSLLTPHRTVVNTYKINKCPKFGSILLGVSREDGENIVSHRVSIKF